MALVFRLISLFMLLACGGCITDQLGLPSAAATPGQPSITITRSDDFGYRAAAASVEINGEEVAMLAAGRSYNGTLTPGRAVLKVSAWTAPLGMGTNRLPSGSTSYRFNVQSGKSYSFVISPRSAPESSDVAHEGAGEATEGGGGAFQIALAQ